jgi:hypothetical protein
MYCHHTKARTAISTAPILSGLVSWTIWNRVHAAMQTRQLPTSRFPHSELNLDIGTIRSIIATCYYPGLEVLAERGGQLFVSTSMS